jgi:hypothetical protein
MGTDIHMAVEVYDDDNRCWQFLPGPVIDCGMCDGTGRAWVATRDENDRVVRDENGMPVKVETGEACTRCGPNVREWEYDDETGEETEILNVDSGLPPGKRRDSWYSDRNYHVFAVLGNVRNGYGFAGTPSSSEIPYISCDRGFPGDLNEQTRVWFRRHGGNHSDTWVYLHEVLEYDWDQTFTKFGVVDEEQFRHYLMHGEPENWCGDISGQKIRKVSNEMMTARLADTSHVAVDDGFDYFTRVTWSAKSRDYAEGFLERMQMLSEAVGDRDCRLVFNFDS